VRGDAAGQPHETLTSSGAITNIWLREVTHRTINNKETFWFKKYEK